MQRERALELMARFQVEVAGRPACAVKRLVDTLEEV